MMNQLLVFLLRNHDRHSVVSKRPLKKVRFHGELCAQQTKILQASLLCILACFFYDARSQFATAFYKTLTPLLQPHQFAIG